MQLKYAFLALAAIASSMSTVLGAEGDVFTAEHIFHEIISEEPFFVTRTTLTTWTQSASITETTTHTPIPETIATEPATARVEPSR